MAKSWSQDPLEYISPSLKRGLQLLDSTPTALWIRHSALVDCRCQTFELLARIRETRLSFSLMAKSCSVDIRALLTTRSGFWLATYLTAHSIHHLALAE